MAVGMRVVHQLVRGGDNAVPLDWIAKARDCLRRIGEIGPQWNKMLAGFQDVVVATVYQELARTGRRRFEVSRRNAFSICQTARRCGEKPRLHFGEIAVMRVEGFVSQLG